jgi:hypothetical protein
MPPKTKTPKSKTTVGADKVIGVSMANMRVIAKRLGVDHGLAAGLWATGWYEARMLATLVDDPVRVTAAQRERWCRDRRLAESAEATPRWVGKDLLRELLKPAALRRKEG